MRYDEAPPPAPASETSSVFRLSTAKPNGVGPADGKTVGPERRPSAPTTYTSIRFVAFSATITALPSSLKPTSAGPVSAPLSERSEPAISVRLPSRPTTNPETLFGTPALRTYSNPRKKATLVGIVPPDDAVSASSSPSGRIRNDEIVLSPALTAKSSWWSSLTMTAPWEPRLDPVPRPPVANKPSGVSEPSAPRW